MCVCARVGVCVCVFMCLLGGTITVSMNHLLSKLILSRFFSIFFYFLIFDCAYYLPIKTNQNQNNLIFYQHYRSIKMTLKCSFNVQRLHSDVFFFLVC